MSSTVDYKKKQCCGVYSASYGVDWPGGKKGKLESFNGPQKKMKFSFEPVVFNGCGGEQGDLEFL